MILFIAITATLNICVGYVLGVYFGQLPGLTLLPRRKVVDPPAAALDLSASKPERKKRRSKAKPKPDDIPDDEPAAEDDPEPTPAQVMDGLAAFQAQLAQASEDMKEAEDDESFDESAGRLQDANHAYLEEAESTIDQLATQSDNEKANETREVLEESTKKVSETSQKIDSILADGDLDDDDREQLISSADSITEAVAEAGGKIEEQIAQAEQASESPADNDAASDQEEAAAQGEESGEEEPKSEPAVEASPADDSDETAPTDDPATAPEEKPTEPKPAEAAEAPEEKTTTPPSDGDVTETDGDTPLAAIDEVEKAIKQALADDSGEPVVIAAVRRDPLELDDGMDDVPEQILTDLIALADETKGAGQLLAAQSDQQLLMLLKGDTVEAASERIERLRQQIEKTTFVAGDAEVHATVTCALAEAVDDVTQEELFENLTEALDEFDQHGPNRSYHHDGRFPAPLMLDGVSVEPREVTLG